MRIHCRQGVSFQWVSNAPKLGGDDREGEPTMTPPVGAILLLSIVDKGLELRLKQYERQLEQYDAEFRIYQEMTHTTEPEEVMVDFVLRDAPPTEASGEEVDHGGR